MRVPASVALIMMTETFSGSSWSLSLSSSVAVQPLCFSSVEQWRKMRSCLPFSERLSVTRLTSLMLGVLADRMTFSPFFTNTVMSLTAPDEIHIYIA